MPTQCAKYIPFRVTVFHSWLRHDSVWMILKLEAKFQFICYSHNPCLIQPFTTNENRREKLINKNLPPAAKTYSVIFRL